jgi:hypothetical protein
MHSVLLAASALAPVSAVAQQVSAAQNTSLQEQSQPQPVQAATEVKQKETAETQVQTEKDKVISGMSILGNQEAPKSLVIVPWKSSEIGNSMNVSTLLDDSRQPVDKEVFMRMLNYYEVRSNTTRHDGAASDGRNTAAADKNTAPPLNAAEQRRKR